VGGGGVWCLGLLWGGWSVVVHFAFLFFFFSWGVGGLFFLLSLFLVFFVAWGCSFMIVLDFS